MRIVRLGQDVDRTGELAPEAIERTRVALAEYARGDRRHGAERVRMVATSATRDAANRGEFVVDGRGEVLGVDPEVVTGGEEAALSFAGAIAGLPGVRRRAGCSSTSAAVRPSWCATAPAAARCARTAWTSAAVRLTERHLRDDPPTAAQVEAAVADVRAALDGAEADVPLDRRSTARRRRRHGHDDRRDGARAGALRLGRDPRIAAQRRAGATRSPTGCWP